MKELLKFIQFEESVYLTSKNVLYLPSNVDVNKVIFINSTY